MQELQTIFRFDVLKRLHRRQQAVKNSRMKAYLTICATRAKKMLTSMSESSVPSIGTASARPVCPQYEYRLLRNPDSTVLL